jgi:hypothetical protein
VVSLRRFVVALAVTVVLVAGPTGPAHAADPGPATTAVTTVLPMPSGIELPNSGQAPEFSGDRGGWAQLTLFGVMSAGMLGIFVRVCFATRQRTRARRLAADASTTDTLTADTPAADTLAADA